MKLLFVSTAPGNSGTATHVVALSKAMAGAGHDVYAVVNKGSQADVGLTDSPIRLRYGRFRNALDPNGYRAVFKAIVEFKPDWIIGNSGIEYWPLAMLSQITRVPLALFRHRTPKMKLLTKLFLPHIAQRFIVVSNFLRNTLIAQGVPPRLIDVLYSPVDMEYFLVNSSARDETLREFGISSEAIVLGYFGRFVRGKGIYTLLEAANQAMEQDPRLHCLWIGEGPELPQLQARIINHRFHSRHHIKGWVHDMGAYYNAISMLALPSLEAEAFGRVMVEAQACGVPVIGSDIGGVPETFHAGHTGLLARAGDIAHWRDTIVKLCDLQWRASYAAAARNHVMSRFSTASIAESFSKMLALPKQASVPPAS